ncbi:hypothetical protein FACS1894211_13400 [Clostridia bacterium]|nr:hypothetical protein FACS1894211_13400 [Clostridia bacterium]
MTTGEDWMEWQANGIAPKILMPKTPTMRKIKEVADAHGYDPHVPAPDKLTAIIDELSAFYAVSKQAAKIRMIELGYPEATEVYNYDSDCTFLSNEITLADAYAEYENNAEFRTLFDVGLFRSVEGYFVIDAPEYRTESENGGFTLTDYARANLSDCTLRFEYNIADLFEFNRKSGVLYREKQRREARPPHDIFAPKINQAVIDKALEQVGALQKEIGELKTFFGETASQTVRRLMESRKWKSSTFAMKTGLNQGLFRKINTVRDKRLELPVVVSICVGLCLPQEISRSLIEQSGHKLRSNSVEDIFYTRVISGVLPSDIPAINAVIDELNAQSPDEKIRPLGSQVYDGRSDGDE